jgi:hypothetical protein
MAPRMKIFAVIAGLHVLALLSRPVAAAIGYSIGSLPVLGQLFFAFYLATIVVLHPFHAIGVPVFLKYETWPEPNLFGYMVATLVWFVAYFLAITAVAFMVSTIRRGKAA